MNATTDTGYTGHATQGAEYDPTRYVTAAEIARNVRAKIKAAQGAGDLPGKADGYKFSVRSERFAGGQAVRINILGPVAEGGSDTAFAFRPVDPASQDDAYAEAYGLTQVYTDDVKRIAGIVRDFAKAQTREDADGQIDYSDVSCYVSVYVGGTGLMI